MEPIDHFDDSGKMIPYAKYGLAQADKVLALLRGGAHS